MQRNLNVNLGNLSLSLSDAMDLANPSLAQHQQRTSFMMWHMGKKARLPEDRLEQGYIAALLHDVGAFSLEEKVALVRSEIQDTEPHSICGERLLAQVPLFKSSARLIRFHHRYWQDWHESIDNPLVFDTQLLALADFVERHIHRDAFILHQHEEIVAKVVAETGHAFHPEIVDIFRQVSLAEEFWLDLVSPRLYSILLHDNPVRTVEVEFGSLLEISNLFRNIIDFRSRFTSTHSSGVAAASAMLSRIFGLTDTEVRLMEVAGNLHDIGKLFVPNAILEKPGQLTKEAMNVVKGHPYYTFSVLKTIEGLERVAGWAAAHHEKLNGEGYPFRVSGSELSSCARILAVADIFTALAEDRPYRKGMIRKDIEEIMRSMAASGQLDARIVKLVFDSYDEIAPFVCERQAKTKAFYEREFAALRG